MRCLGGRGGYLWEEATSLKAQTNPHASPQSLGRTDLRLQATGVLTNEEGRRGKPAREGRGRKAGSTEKWRQNNHEGEKGTGSGHYSSIVLSPRRREDGGVRCHSAALKTQVPQQPTAGKGE